MSLPKLRKQYTDTALKIEALTRANDARKEEAKSVRRELEAAALSNDAAQVEVLMENLGAMEAAYRTIKMELREANAHFAELNKEIATYYKRAVDGGPKVDWSVRLGFKDDALYDGWDRRRKPGNLVILDVELCESEIFQLREMMPHHNIKLKEHQGAYRLQVEGSVYRNSCWSDRDGRWIVQQIAGLLEASELANRVEQFLEKLEVTR